MAPPLPPNPCLVAIALVIDSKSGPRFVFHYPAHPRDDLPPKHSIWNGYGDGVAESDSASDTRYWSSDDDDDGDSVHEAEHGRSKGFRVGRERGGPDDEEDSSDDEEKKRQRRLRAAGAPWETVFGFPINNGLEKILIPPRSFHKKRFELGLEPLTYLGCPIFVREDGFWRKKKRDKYWKDGEGHGIEGLAGPDEVTFADGIDRPGDRGRQDGASATQEGDDAASGSIQRKKRSSSASRGSGYDNYDAGDEEDEEEEEEEEAKSTASEDDRRAMSMFNVVFVMNAPLLEHNLRIKDMFEHVLKKFAKALKYEQARSNWVWRQSEMILNMKERAKDQNTSLTTLWHQILSKSGLAKALSEVFLSISTSKIAHVFINEAFDVSLQIPQVVSIADLPTAIEPQMPGVWLTTANSIENDELDGITLAKHFALLLLDDVGDILRDIDHEHGPKEVSHPLAEFVQLVKPTMSFLQMSQLHNISLRRIQFLSRHLIYWRRARAIPPLHRRDTYIVSPNADMRCLASATQAYAARFPSLLSLPKMLSMLSGHPRAYATIIPSKDHRDAYMDILAWLMRGGWVTQLRTFGWVRVPREIKAAVRRKMRIEEEQRHAEQQPEVGEYGGEKHGTPTWPRSRSASDLKPAFNANSDREDGMVNERREINGRRQIRSTRNAKNVEDEDEEDEGEEEATILLEPHKANNLESRWLDEIGQYLLSGPLKASSTRNEGATRNNHHSGSTTRNGLYSHHRSNKSFSDQVIGRQWRDDADDDDDDDERERRNLQEAWTRFTKYFNGQNALEKIPVREEGFLERVEEGERHDHVGGDDDRPADDNSNGRNLIKEEEDERIDGGGGLVRHRERSALDVANDRSRDGQAKDADEDARKGIEGEKGRRGRNDDDDEEAAIQDRGAAPKGEQGQDAAARQETREGQSQGAAATDEGQSQGAAMHEGPGAGAAMTMMMMMREGQAQAQQLPLALRLKMIKPKTKLKRKDMWRWINEMERRGFLVLVRHW